MSIVPFKKRSDFGNVYQTRRQVDSLLDNLFNNNWMAPFERLNKHLEKGLLSPLSDIAETKDEYQVSVELPGLKDEDVEISLEDNVLTIKGEKKQEETKEERNYHYAERSYGAFERSISLPDNIKADAISATFNNGVLNISIPKMANPPSTVKKIPLKKK